jgi:plasmid stabilization system protein ParE
LTKPARFTAQARREFVQALREMEHPSAAERLARAVENAARHIGRHPALGRIELALADTRYRFWSLSGFPYLLVYRPDPTPLVVRFVHTARDLPSVLSGL